MAGGERSNGGNVTPIRPDLMRLPLVSPGQWEGKAAPKRLWLWDDMIPVMRATLLTGEGGSGKSLFAQQLATCVALGLPFLGIPTRQQAALYVTCEDDVKAMKASPSKLFASNISTRSSLRRASRRSMPRGVKLVATKRRGNYERNCAGSSRSRASLNGSAPTPSMIRSR